MDLIFITFIQIKIYKLIFLNYKIYIYFILIERLMDSESNINKIN